jgi:hypothetical protein
LVDLEYLSKWYKVQYVKPRFIRGDLMAIQSVTYAISTYSSSNTQTSQTQQTQQAQQTQQVEQREPRPEERVEKKEEPQRPVVNAQGQQTGTLINVVA